MGRGEEPGRARVTEGGEVVLADPRGLRAVAHPARQHAIMRLYRGDPLTATELAAELGVTASAMSYHLRELERWGLVVRGEASGDARERPWLPAGSRFSLGVAGFAGAGSAALSGWVATMLGGLTERLAGLADELAADDPRRLPGTIAEGEYWLTEEEAELFAAELNRLNERFGFGERTPRRHPEGTRRYQAWTFLLPEPADP